MANELGRRNFVGGAAGVAASALAGGGLSSGAAAGRPAGSAGSAKPYGVQYYERVNEIWDAIVSNELPILAQAADEAARSLKNNGKLYCQVVGGHMHLAEMRRDRAGNPGYLPNLSRNVKPELFDAAGKGDFILFDYPKEHIRKARDRGAFTVGIRVPYHANKTTPKGVLAMNELAQNPVFADVLLPEECCSIILTSHVPFTDGLLYIPEIPAVRACGSSPQGTFNLYWMLTAEIAMRHRGGGAMGSTGKAREFMETIKERGARIRKNLEVIDAVARDMAERVSHGARYWNFPVRYTDENSAIEPWSIMVEENTNRASGLVMSKTLDLTEVKEKAKPGDFIILAAEFSDVKENIEATRAFKKAGLKIIYIGPRTEGSRGEDLPRLADWHVDTFSPEREGVVKIPGIDKKICPTTGVLYALAQYVLNAQFIGHMIQADMTPLLFMGLHLIGGKAYYDVVEALFETRGY